MPDIHYVCLSDMHLGSDSSVLTHIQSNNRTADFTQPSPVLCQLVTCLRELIGHNESKKNPILILNGDILELALSETNEAAMVFERFIELIFPQDGEPLFDYNILYNPGNHDHHIWEISRETQYTEFISSARAPVGQPLPVPWHTTKMLFSEYESKPEPEYESKPIPNYFLTNLIQRYPHLKAKDATISVIYPNYALQNSQRCVIFSHGHYVEPLYSLMSTLNSMLFPPTPEAAKKPKVIWDLEAENFAWVDFFWSSMTRSGAAGRDIALIYAKLQEEAQIEKLVETFLHSWLAQTHQFQLAKEAEEAALREVLNFLLKKLFPTNSNPGETKKGPLLERNKPVLLSPDALQGLHSYLEGSLLEQIRDEEKKIGHTIPADITFIFGHTHKPFSQDMQFIGYPTETKVYNSGGWVVDTVKPRKVYGAAAILIDETYQTISLRLYNQEDSVAKYSVSVEESIHSGVTSSAFHDRISALVKPSSEPWKTFSKTVAEAVAIRSQVLQYKIDL